MLKIRLQRVGRKHDPSFRVVLTDSKNGPKSGKFLEILGNYNAKKDVKVVNGERIKYWMGQGAQVSDTVYNILISEKLINGKKINALPKKSPIVKEETEEKKKEKVVSTDDVEETTTESPAEETPKENNEEVVESESIIEEKKEA